MTLETIFVGLLRLLFVFSIVSQKNIQKSFRYKKVILNRLSYIEFLNSNKISQCQCRYHQSNSIALYKKLCSSLLHFSFVKAIA